MSKTVRTTITTIDPNKEPLPAWRARIGALVGAIDRSDVLVMIGLSLVGAGTWQFSPPAAAVAVGVIVLFYALPTRPPFVGGSH